MKPETCIPEKLSPRQIDRVNKIVNSPLEDIIDMEYPNFIIKKTPEELKHPSHYYDTYEWLLKKSWVMGHTMY
jgi:hypothetical protein